MNNNRIIYLVIIIICSSSLLMGGVPHAVIGTIKYSDASIPSRISWEAFITSRPTEKIEFAPPSLYDSLSGGFLIQCGGFSSWNAAETLHVNFSDHYNAAGFVNVVLSYDPYDDVGDIILKTPDALEKNEQIKPAHFELYQNYPNPFNPETVISYKLEKPQIVSLEIYNSTGESVYSIPEEFKNSGEHHVVWNGRDDSGQLVASGVYIYVLKSENQTQRLKAVFVR